MKMIEYLTHDISTLSDFIDLAQSDGLQAKGCSLDLLLPQNDTGGWDDWLEQEYADAYDAECAVREMRRQVNESAMRKGD